MSKFEFEVITDEKAWKKLVDKSAHRDIHSLPGYVGLLAVHLGGEPVLFYWGDDDNYIIWPYIKRKINSRSQNYFDLVSSWYYGGPLINGELDIDIIKQYFKEFTNYCQSNNIITEFSRFHPDIDNHIKFEPLLQLNRIGVVVWLDLNQDLEHILYNSFEKRARTAVRRSERSGVEVIIDSSDEYLKAFHELYTRSMDAKKAREFYYFDLQFITDMRNTLSDNFTLICVKHEDNITGGSIFIHGYDKMYYYLSARDPDLDKAAANNRVLYEAIKFGQAKNLNIFDLGGGPEGSSLLRFKQSFSKNIKDLYGYNKVHDTSVYQQLCLEKGINKSDLNFDRASFFPEYRME
jgi:lipid II:glycine glycyltransferase (peptidoglycan interpeptide bridge formation enzyme)